MSKQLFFLISFLPVMYLHSMDKEYTLTSLGVEVNDLQGGIAIDLSDPPDGILDDKILLQELDSFLPNQSSHITKDTRNAFVLELLKDLQAEEPQDYRRLIETVARPNKAPESSGSADITLLKEVLARKLLEKENSLLSSQVETAQGRGIMGFSLGAGGVVVGFTALIGFLLKSSC